MNKLSIPLSATTLPSLPDRVTPPAYDTARVVGSMIDYPYPPDDPDVRSEWAIHDIDEYGPAAAMADHLATNLLEVA